MASMSIHAIEKQIHEFSLGFQRYFGLKVAEPSTSSIQHHHVVGEGPREGWHLRPNFHITGDGWINDPCAPGYDAETGLYHLFYQCNPEGCEWGNMSWGHVTSEDLVSWFAENGDPALVPGQTYDKEGVFTGCFHPTGLKGQRDQLTVIYSSITKLPFHWSEPYPKNPAGLSVATSADGGNTWVKHSGNPILEGEPEGIDVTGFRDPFLSEWKSMDALLGGKSLYGVVAGGIRDQGPTAWIYKVKENDLTSWELVGPLMHVPSGFQPSKKWNGDAGVNWECAGFMTLKSVDEAYSREFLVAGVEGASEREHLVGHARPDGVQDRSTGQVLWMAGEFGGQGKQKSPADLVKMDYKFGGVLDHGCWYAASSFLDPVRNSRVVWGWMREEDVSLERCKTKEWTGYIGLPRELSLLTIFNVKKALVSPLSDIANIEVLEQDNDTATLLTLGIRPLADLSKLHHNDKFVVQDIALPSSKSPLHDFQISSSNWRLEATISIKDASACREVGFAIRHNTPITVLSTITFSPQGDEITFDRSASNNQLDIAKHTEKGAHTLFTTVNENGEEELEKLKFTIFCDGDAVEVFVNDRFAMSSFVYVNQETCGGISAFVDGEKESCVFEQVEIWTGLSA